MNEKEKVFINFFKAISNEDRLEIIRLLQDKNELCAQDVQKNFFLEQSTTSHHLNKLRLAGITKVRKSGRNMIYSFDKESMKQTLLDFIDYIFDEDKNPTK